jgi:putative peptidoglycan lipid II flippase
VIEGWLRPLHLGAILYCPMSLLKSASIVSVLTLASRLTGLVRELLMAAMFGAGGMTDAFYVAFRIPNLLRRLFAEGAFSQAFVPVLAASKEKHGEAATALLIDKVATVLAWAVVLTSLLGVLAAPLLVYAMASGLQQNPQAFEAAGFMTRLMFPYIACMSLVALAAGVLNTWKKFAVPAVTPVLLNVCMILAAWLLAPWFKARGIEPIYAMAVGVMAGGVLQLAVQIPALRSLGMLPRIALSRAGLMAAWQDAGTQNVLRLMFPALLGVGVSQISLLINTQIASHLVTGSVSWLTYADRLMEFPTAMLGVALGVVLMPQLAAAKAAGDDQKYSGMIDWGLRIVLLLAIPSAVALLTFAQPLVAALNHYGAFKDSDVGQVARALMGYGVGLIGLVAIKILAPAYYAKQDIKTPVKIAVMVLVFTQIMNYLLVPYFQHAALALSIGLGALLNAGCLLWGLRHSNTYMPLAGWGRFALQVVAASALLAIFLMWANSSLPWIEWRATPLKRIMVLALVISAGAAIYFIACWAAGLKLRALLRK